MRDGQGEGRIRHDDSGDPHGREGLHLGDRHRLNVGGGVGDRHARARWRAQDKVGLGRLQVLDFCYGERERPVGRHKSAWLQKLHCPGDRPRRLIKQRFNICSGVGYHRLRPCRDLQIVAILNALGLGDSKGDRAVSRRDCVHVHASDLIRGQRLKRGGCVTHRYTVWRRRQEADRVIADSRRPLEGQSLGGGQHNRAARHRDSRIVEHQTCDLSGRQGFDACGRIREADRVSIGHVELNGGESRSLRGRQDERCVA